MCFFLHAPNIASLRLLTSFMLAFAFATAQAQTGGPSDDKSARKSPVLVAETAPAAMRGAPPENDDRANAAAITENGTYTGTNVEATPESGDGTSCVPSGPSGDNGQSVWWVYTASEDEVVRVDLDGSAFDTILSFNRTTSDDIVCNDDDPDNVSAADFTSRLLYPVASGETIYLRVSGFGEEGAIALHFEAAAASLTTASGTTTGGTTFARPDDAGSGASGSCSVESGAFPFATETFTAGTAGDYVVAADWTGGHDGFLALYDNSFTPSDPCAGLIAVNDDILFQNDGFNDLSASLIETELQAGATYTVVATGYDPSESGTYALRVAGPGGVVASEGDVGADGTAFALAGPNPFASRTVFQVVLPEAAGVEVRAYDTLGRAVAVLHSGPLPAGRHVMPFAAATLAPGPYVVRLRVDGGATVRSQTVTVLR